MTVSSERALQPAVAGFIGGAAAPGAFEGILHPDGTPLPAWERLLAAMGQLGAEGFAERAEDGRRILREHGVSVPAPGGGDGAERPWELDFLPLVLGASEWRHLEEAMCQRASLLNALLQDLHGNQRLVRHGFLPAPLLFANPGYLRACQAIAVPDGAYLHTYAADLGRSPDGQWWVLADRTQAPAGLGFAQESRTVMSRVLPEAVQALHPRSLAETWRSRRETLRRLGTAPSGASAAVLLTPGPRSEAWFEHAYLTRVLGIPLVEAEDLTVRDRRVFLKTLDGLRPVSLIMRRVGDAWCDPLELRSDSLLGVPGLVEATRAGQVAIVNALGTGLVEGPGFLPFLPGLCRQVLGEDLRLPSVLTWWCGQARDAHFAREEGADLIVQSAFALSPSSGGQGRAPAPDAVSRAPHEFVGQQPVRLSRLPVRRGGSWKAEPFVLRLFAVRSGDTYTVVPGGLARLVDDDHAASCALSLAGLCKDVWVLPDPAAAVETQHVVVPAPLPRERAAADLPSRTADNFFWLGRYTERLEQLVRLARCGVGRLVDEAGPGGERTLPALGRLLARLGLVPVAQGELPSREWLQKQLLLFVHKEGRSPGVRELLHQIHLAAFAVRYRLSADTWRILNRLAPDARQRPTHLPLLMTASVLHNLTLDLAAFSGMETENMTRGHAWLFLELGRRLERAHRLTDLLAALLEGGEDVPLLLEPALEVADSVMTHRWRYFDQPRPEGVLELLLHDSTNPRSVAFQLLRMAELASRLPARVNPDGVAHFRRRIDELHAALAPPDTLGRADSLAAVVGRLVPLGCDLLKLAELLSQVYFSQVPLRLS